MSNKELDEQYKNSKNSYEVFYDHDDETEVTQYRFFLEDDDPEIKNKHSTTLCTNAYNIYSQSNMKC